MFLFCYEIDNAVESYLHKLGVIPCNTQDTTPPRTGRVPTPRDGSMETFRRDLSKATIFVVCALVFENLGVAQLVSFCFFSFHCSPVCSVCFRFRLFFVFVFVFLFFFIGVVFVWFIFRFVLFVSFCVWLPLLVLVPYRSACLSINLEFEV